MMEKFMHFITIKENFYAFGIIVFVSVVFFFKKRGLIFLLLAAATVGLNDFICHNVLKEIFARQRPCHMINELSYIANCSNSFSFPSNHASNMFTAATFISLVFRKTPATIGIVYTFALLVGYSRVYLGAHYPFDVLAGALFGGLMGFLGYKAYQKAISIAGIREPAVEK
jgi:undecaprenyl-diphosphatase